jgi:Uma2 family endonuclease
MTKATQSKMTFEDYLNYDDDTDKRYEFMDGELVEVPPESPLNSHIARFLFVLLAQVLPEEQICYKDTELAVSGSQIQVRLPDLMVLSPELAALLGASNRATIFLEMPPPLLVMEVVSPGAANAKHDYRYKRSEYAARGISEYWVIDPGAEKITVFTLVDGFYEEAVYTGNMQISSQIEVLRMTASEVLTRKRAT